MHPKQLFTVSMPFACLLSLAACSSPPGPSQPEVGPKTPGVFTIDPSLVPFLDVPEGEQNYSYNEVTGLLEYNTVVRNKGTRAMTLSITAYFRDEKKRLVEEHSPIRFFIDPNTEKPLQIMANDKRSREIRVNVRPAK